MHAEYLRFVVEQLLNDVQAIKLLENWAQLISAVEQQIASPSQDNAQLVISQRDTIRTSLETSVLSRIPTTWKAMIRDLEADYLASANLNRLLDGIAEENALSLQDKLGGLKRVRDNLKGDIDAFKGISDSFDWLKIPPMTLPTGEGEVAVYIPREIFENELEGLQDELADLDQLMRTCEEIVTGSTPSSPQIRYFSTSDPVFWLYATPGVAYFVLKLVNMLLDAYEKVLRIRKMKAELTNIGTEREFTKGLDNQAELLVEKAVDNLLDFAKKRFTSRNKDAGRANELLNALRISATALASKIDNGYRIEARVELAAETQDESGSENSSGRTAAAHLTDEEIEELKALSEKVRHFEPIGDPVLALPKQRRARTTRKGKSDKKAD